MIERLLQPRLLELATRYPVLTLTGRGSPARRRSAGCVSRPPVRLAGEPGAAGVCPGGPGRLPGSLRGRRRDRRGPAGAADLLLSPGPGGRGPPARPVPAHRLAEPGAGGRRDPVARRPHHPDRAAAALPGGDPPFSRSAHGARHAAVGGRLPEDLRAAPAGSRVARRLHRHLRGARRAPAREDRRPAALPDLPAPLRRRTGQILNLSSLANDCGISPPDGALLALGAGGELHRLPPPAVLRQPRQEADQGAQALLLRHGPRGQPPQHREPAPTRHPPLARGALRDLGGGRDRQGAPPSRTPAADVLLPRPQPTGDRRGPGAGGPTSCW
jgi:hypothetical protein